jgi:hypothetical protein
MRFYSGITALDTHQHSQVSRSGEIGSYKNKNNRKIINNNNPVDIKLYYGY